MFENYPLTIGENDTRECREKCVFRGSSTPKDQTRDRVLRGPPKTTTETETQEGTG